MFIKLYEQWLMEDDVQATAQPAQPTTTPTTTVQQAKPAGNEYKITVSPTGGSGAFDVIATSDAEYKTAEATSFLVKSSTNTSVLPGQILAVGKQNDDGTVDVMISSEDLDPSKVLNFGGAKISIAKNQ